ncbi:class III lanthionine synthetase LanKC N-terminal domain-containing protein [Actinophytocola gossypii]|uniref:Protein kinase domain-containing protein n=1 Tax=Actinophytocola gossypii TaxID=2812003 RepID=A0ABT2JGQ6_9PSEU|nr:lanthionine synthetase LanC family protein [Actinophytocola gossypii]MCT2587062.1 hypothetical protein [Actinophytocola gossypii]
MSVRRTRSAVEPVSTTARQLAGEYRTTYQLRADGGWWHFDPISSAPLPPQGWKLHVSASPLTAAEALRRVARIVLPRGVRWKSAQTVDQLARLSGPPTPLSQVGKFITVYVDDEDHLPVLAEQLHTATRDLTGPVVPSDRRYRRESNVYLRYGAFTRRSDYAVPEQTRQSYLVDPDGNQVPDVRAPGQTRPPWVPEPPLPDAREPRRHGDGLFGRGITVHGVLNQSAKGGVYRGTWRGRDVVVKEGRAGTCPDLIGRDAGTRLRNEWTILRRLSGTGLAPEPLDLFVERDNVYLVEEFLPGVTLRASVENANYLGRPDPDELRNSCRAVADLAARLRDHGVRPRDFTPNNIMVHEGRYTAVDLELFEIADSPEPPFAGWTPGYAPSRDGRPPDAGDTDFAVAAITYFVLTGIDPFLGRAQDISTHVDALLTAFGPTETEPVEAELDLVRTRLGGPVRSPSGTPAPGPAQIVEEAVEAGLELTRRVEWDRASWPWPEEWSSGLFHPACFHTGTTGVARYYLDLWHATGDRAWLDHADDLLDWTFTTVPFVPGRTPPGLHFGIAALPWLAADLANLVDPGRAPVLRERAVQLADALVEADPGSWDITHGWAGIGLAQVGTMLATGGDADRRAAVTRIAHHVLAAGTDRDGLLVWPRGGEPDTYSTGFAHGSAGIGYFLLAAGTATGDHDLVDAATGVAAALPDLGVPTAGGAGLSWRSGPTGRAVPWTHWCNGAAGVGALLLSAGLASGDPALIDAARRAGRAITRGRAYGSTCRCHGLAGDGDFLLDLAARADHDGEFRRGAETIGRKLDALRFRDGFAWKWAHEGGGEPRPSYMRGYLGVHAFRLRLAGLVADAPLTIAPARSTP